MKTSTRRLFSLSVLTLMLSFIPMNMAIGNSFMSPQIAEAVDYTSSPEDILAACQNGTLQGEKVDHVVTGYYSPLPPQFQSHYVMNGTWEKETQMNGKGTNGASGAQVFYGMIAAPSSYAFGTKICLPDKGWIVEVQDRGGAIKDNRIDVWSGAGTDGLELALGIGKREWTGINLGVNPDIPNYVNFDTIPRADTTRLYPSYFGDPANAEKDIYHAGDVLNLDLEVNDYFQNITASTVSSYTQVAASHLTFKNNLYLGDSGEEVRKMQEYLIAWGYDTEATGFFGQQTVNALIEFQMDSGVIDSPYAFGGGNFGPGSREAFESFLDGTETTVELVTKNTEVTLDKFPDLYEENVEFLRGLSIGDTGADVLALQQLLAEMGFIRSELTGSFDSVTQNAVLRYQLKEGIIDSEWDDAAGYVGPSTRAYLNEILEERYSFKLQLAMVRVKFEEESKQVLTVDNVTAVIPKFA